MNIKRNTLIFFLIGVFAFLFGCDSGMGNGIKSQISFPLIKECKNTVEYELNEFEKQGYIKYNIKLFDTNINAFPNLIGVVTVYSKDLDKKDVIGIVNRPIINCYPITSRHFSLNNENLSKDILQSMSLLRSHENVEYFYPTLKDDSLNIYFYREIK